MESQSREHRYASPALFSADWATAARSRTAVGLSSTAGPGRWVVKAAPDSHAVTAPQGNTDIRHHATLISSATDLLERCLIGHSYQPPPTPSPGLADGHREGIGQEPDRFSLAPRSERPQSPPRP